LKNTLAYYNTELNYGLKDIYSTGQAGRPSKPFYSSNLKVETWLKRLTRFEVVTDFLNCGTDQLILEPTSFYSRPTALLSPCFKDFNI